MSVENKFARKLRKRKLPSVAHGKFDTEKSDINSNKEVYKKEVTRDSNRNETPKISMDNSETFSNEDNLCTDSEPEIEEEKVSIQFKNAQGDNKCNHCKEYFENPIMLLRHKRENHSFPKTLLPLEEIEKYYDYPNRSFCPICKKVIKTNNYRSVFVKHLHTHTVVHTFECVICKKKFRRKDHMLSHQKRHVVPIEDFIRA